MTATDINPRARSTGYDRVRFVKPVFIGDTIRAETTIKEKRDHPERASHGVVVELLEVSNQAGETVLVASTSTSSSVARAPERNSQPAASLPASEPISPAA